jgi:hypothetical protein
VKANTGRTGMKINALLEALGHVLYNSIRKASQQVMESLLEYLSTILFTIPLPNACYIYLYRIKPINVATVSWTVISLVTSLVVRAQATG